jgi:predicted DsbA family dithiol-disulfide isomerase
MKVEIWSDVLCPFCYIGKRRFEQALTKFEHADEVEIIWRSFQLDPEMRNVPGKNIHEYLAEKKGRSLKWAKQMNERVVEMAREVGLEYDFDKAVPANSFDAHRLVHFAAMHGLADRAEEHLFAAYFTQGSNIEDRETLVRLGAEIGLTPAKVREMLEGDDFSKDVRLDFEEASAIGAPGVPFYVFDRKFAISGAQPSDVFSKALSEAFSSPA